MEHKWWLDEFYGFLIIRPYHALTRFLAQPVDLGVIDQVSAGLGAGVQWMAGGLRRMQTGFVRSYGFMVLLGVVIIMAYLITR
jgi:NADH-quinone oxidoreductase subunit L